MVTINLLPWRDQLREERKKQFLLLLLLTILIIVLFLIFFHVFISRMIAMQNSRNQYLQEEIRKIDEKISEIKNHKEEQKKFLTYMNLIYGLQNDMLTISHLFAEFANRIPNGVYLTQLKRDGNTIRLQGCTNSNAAISQLIRNLTLSPWLENPTLNKIEIDEKTVPKKSNFELTVSERQNQNLITLPIKLQE